jgi:hypothetical protein
MTQILPFADPIVLKLYDEFERATYGVESTLCRAEERAGTSAMQ